MTNESLIRLVEQEWRALQQAHDQWSVLSGPKDMELVAHVLRVILHMGQAAAAGPEYEAVVRVQHADGGWGRESTDEASAAWVSAFLGLMLIRGNVERPDARLAEAVWRSIRYFLASQQPDGRWVDREWGDLDTTSHPVSFFNVVLALGTEAMKEAVRPAWRRGLQFILQGQSPDGGWYDPVFHPSGVETTAHLGQDAVVASLALPEGLAVRPSCEQALAWILAHQAPDGSWDEQNVDHTMDCTRSTLLISRMLGAEPRCRSALEQALAWIVAAKNPQGWPDFLGGETSLERTCDGLDLLLKFQAWRQEDPLAVVRRWGYTAGRTMLIRPEPAAGQQAVAAPPPAPAPAPAR